MSYIRSVTFSVDPVKVETPIIIDHKTLIQKRLQKQTKTAGPPIPPKKIEASSCNSSKTYKNTSETINSFFDACFSAYTGHYNLTLSIEQVKLFILQGFAIHCKLNADKFRNLFVDDVDKKIIEIKRDDLIIGGKSNDWTNIFEQFADKLKNDIKDPNLVSMIQTENSTSTVSSIAAMNIAMLDTFSEYNDVVLSTLCGIPNITLEGKPSEWKQLEDFVKYLANYDLDWWVIKILPILRQFTEASKHNVDKCFWQNMIKKQGGSGVPYLSGWLIDLFPYFKEDDKYFCNNTDTQLINVFMITTKYLPAYISSVDFVWDCQPNPRGGASCQPKGCHDSKYPMKFHAGFVGVEVKNKSLTPMIGYAIEHA